MLSKLFGIRYLISLITLKAFCSRHLIWLVCLLVCFVISRGIMLNILFAFGNLKALLFVLLVFTFIVLKCFYYHSFLSWHSSLNTWFGVYLIVLWSCQGCSLVILWALDDKYTTEYKRHLFPPKQRYGGVRGNIEWYATASQGNPTNISISGSEGI